MGFSVFLKSFFKNRNPVLKSDRDITKDLIQSIIENDLDSLTIDYEFAIPGCNPFQWANDKHPIERIEFKVILTRNVTSLKDAFRGMESLKYVNLTDTSMITNMSGMFAGAESFNQPVGNWDVSNVTDMSEMFSFAESFNQPLDNWDVSNVTDMSAMFCSAKSFNQPIGNWEVSSVTDMSDMFLAAESFNQPLEKWDISNVINMIGMFSGATSYSYPYIYPKTK